MSISKSVPFRGVKPTVVEYDLDLPAVQIKAVQNVLDRMPIHVVIQDRVSRKARVLQERRPTHLARDDFDLGASTPIDGARAPILRCNHVLFGHVGAIEQVGPGVNQPDKRALLCPPS